MTKDAKWIIVGGGLGLCYLLVWMTPLILLLYLVLVIAVFAMPTKPSKRSSTIPLQSSPTAPVVQPSVAMSDVEQQLHEKIAAARNDDVREGLRQALELIRNSKHSTQPASHTFTAQAASTAGSSVYQQPPKPLSEHELAEAKQKQELKNINTILYVACFLLIGAAALFIGFTNAVDETTKFVALLLVTLLFYVAGMILHTTAPKVRPAAVAFVGTGLALLPFVGLGFYNYIWQDASLAWWLTSLLGLAGFWLALLRIRTQVMSYLTIAFVFSLTTSTISVLDSAIVWYFVVVILTSSVMMYLSHKQPTWLPAEVKVPLEQNAQLATPLALIGSLWLFNSMSAIEYALVSGVGALHYAVNALTFKTDPSRYIYFTLARALTIVFALTLTYYFTEDWKWLGVTLGVCAVLSHLYSLRHVSDQREIVWLWFSQVAVIISALTWLEDMWIVAVGIAVLSLLSLHQLVIIKRSEYGAGLLVGLALLPVVIGRGALDVSVSWEVLSLVILVLSLGFFGLRLTLYAQLAAYRQVFSAGYVLLIAEALLLVCLTGDWAWIGSMSLVGAVLFYMASFVEKTPWVHLVSNILAVIGLGLLLTETDIASAWIPLVTAWVLTLVWYGLRWYFTTFEESQSRNERIDIMTGSVAALVFLAAFYSVLSNQETVVAGALTGLALAGLIAYEGLVRHRSSFYEIAIALTTLSLQRLVANVYPDANLLVYTHWWALTMGVIALIRLQAGRRDDAKVRGVLALVILSVPTGFYALIEPSTYQYLFLLEHAALLVAGFMLEKKLVIQWSSVAIGLAMLWLLSSYTFILLTVIALGLLGLAIWRLTKK